MASPETARVLVAQSALGDYDACLRAGGTKTDCAARANAAARDRANARASAWGTPTGTRAPGTRAPGTRAPGTPAAPRSAVQTGAELVVGTELAEGATAAVALAPEAAVAGGVVLIVLVVAWALLFVALAAVGRYAFGLSWEWAIILGFVASLVPVVLVFVVAGKAVSAAWRHFVHKKPA